MKILQNLPTTYWHCKTILFLCEILPIKIKMHQILKKALKIAVNYRYTQDSTTLIKNEGLGNPKTVIVAFKIEITLK